MIPEISCLMSNYNTSRDILRQSIESILEQSFKNFEFIIVDDCSSDDSLDLIKEYQKKDARIIIIENKENIGLAASMNKAIKLSKGSYIARMDSDDIACKDRFEKQYAYMRRTGLDICGTFAQCFGASNQMSFTPFYNEKYTKAHLLTSAYLIHPSVMIKKAFLTDNNLEYNERYRCAQDIELWHRAAKKGRIGTLNSVLLKYRIHNKQATTKGNKLQQDLCFSTECKAFHELGSFDSKDKELFAMLCKYESMTENDYKKFKELIYKISTYVPRQEKLIYKKILTNRLFNLIMSGLDSKSRIVVLLKNPWLLNLTNIYSVVFRIVFILRNRNTVLR